VKDPQDSEVDRVLAAGNADAFGPRYSIDGISDVKVRVRANQLTTLARLSSVLWIEPWAVPQLLDEKQDQILAGNYTGSTVSTSGYLSWLASKGITSTPDFVVDVTDSGIDRGDLDPQVIH